MSLNLGDLDLKVKIYGLGHKHDLRVILMIHCLESDTFARWTRFKLAKTAAGGGIRCPRRHLFHLKLL